MIRSEGRKIRPEIHKLMKSVLNKEELPEEWKESTIVPIYKKGDYSNYRGISFFVSYLENFIQHPAVKLNSICRENYRGSSVWILKQQVNY
jgi:hypothetical protein